MTDAELIIEAIYVVTDDLKLLLLVCFLVTGFGLGMIAGRLR